MMNTIEGGSEINSEGKGVSMNSAGREEGTTETDVVTGEIEEDATAGVVEAEIHMVILDGTEKEEDNIMEDQEEIVKGETEG